MPKAQNPLLSSAHPLTLAEGNDKLIPFLKECADKLGKENPLFRGLVLFGSRSTGYAHKRSDADVLVYTHYDSDRQGRSAEEIIQEAAGKAGLGFEVRVLPVNPGHLQEGISNYETGPVEEALIAQSVRIGFWQETRVIAKRNLGKHIQ